MSNLDGSKSPPRLAAVAVRPIADRMDGLIKALDLLEESAGELINKLTYAMDNAPVEVDEGNTPKVGGSLLLEQIVALTLRVETVRRALDRTRELVQL